MRWISKLRPSPSMVVALLALFVAMGGVSYAAAKIGSKQIKNNSVRGKDIHNGTITSKDVKKNTLGGTRIVESKLGQVPSAKKADTVGPNGVDTTAIQDNAVTTTKIANNAVTTGKIADNAVTNTKIADDAVTQSKLATDSVGADELKSTILVSATTAIGANAGNSRSVQCPAGTQAISGGGTASAFTIYMVSSFRSGNGWIIANKNDTATPGTATVYATCLVG